MNTAIRRFKKWIKSDESAKEIKEAIQRGEEAATKLRKASVLKRRK